MGSVVLCYRLPLRRYRRLARPPPPFPKIATPVLLCVVVVTGVDNNIVLASSRILAGWNHQTARFRRARCRRISSISNRHRSRRLGCCARWLIGLDRGWIRLRWRFKLSCGRVRSNSNSITVGHLAACRRDWCIVAVVTIRIGVTISVGLLILGPLLSFQSITIASRHKTEAI